MADIDTRKVTEYRSLRFNSIDECVAEVKHILEADQAGTLRTLGNWTGGQILTHLAAWIEYGYEGYPMRPVPFFIRWMMQFQLRKILKKGMSRGVKIPGIQGGTVGMEAIELPAAGDRLVQAWQRLKNNEEAQHHSPAFGPMSHEDRIQLNLRHAELHLGFFTYERKSL